MLISGWFESDAGAELIELDAIDESHAAHELFNAVGDAASGVDAEIEAEDDSFSATKMWAIYENIVSTSKASKKPPQ